MHRYSSGDWYTLVTPDGLAMLPDSVTPEFVERVWLALSKGHGLGAVLEGIVGAFGTSLSSLPPFAVASRTSAGDGVQVAVRGPIEVVVKASGAETAVTGLGVTTWSERSIDGVDVVQAALPGAAAVSLPINDGVVLANRILFAFQDAHFDKAAPAEAVRIDARQATPSLIDAPLVPETAAEAPEDPGTVEFAPDEVVERVPVLAPQEPVRAPQEPIPGPQEPVPAAEESAESREAPEAFAEEQAFSAPSGETTIAPLAGDLLALAEDEFDDDYDQLLYGDTVRSTVEDAAVRVTEDDSQTEHDGGARPIISGLPSFAHPDEAPSSPELGDHDGETISIAKLRALQTQASTSASASGLPALPGHAPSPITLVVSTGERITLDRGAVVGRRPRLARVQGGNVPQLVTVPSPNQDVSRSHVELRVEGAHLLAVDLDTTNGTKLLRPGVDPVRLQPGDATMLVAGDRLDLGDGILLDFEGLR
ncbi:FHA domain-containing protein [Sinomonas sp. JGH33]|uniref:FHA domain-containing protein n=1 Tax=Sinomonas terricola TaxID=3110330 RepID=A0ABU5T9M5_9MICC|nr:FHA domain-containing protein [Sinomonas sp. JGH33]MEA5456394.1 FHA domain-containing protein [Sinomonas sp. JGH33]